MDKKESREIQEEFELIFEVTSTEGWKIIVDHFKQQRESVIDVMTTKCETNDDYWKLRGNLFVLNQIINYREQMKNMCDLQNNEQELMNIEEEFYS